MPTILLARHAQASYGAADYDVLSELGEQQAELLAADLKRRGVRIDQVISGPLKRQRDTAGAVAAAYGHDVTIDPRWEEYDTADILDHHFTTPAREELDPTGATPMLSSRDFQVILDAGMAEWITAADGSPAAEPWPAFAARVDAALRAVAASLEPGTTALVCTSAGVLGVACAALLGLPPHAAITFNRVAVNTGVTKVVLGRGGTTLVSFNEHAHLELPSGSIATYR